VVGIGGSEWNSRKASAAQLGVEGGACILSGASVESHEYRPVTYPVQHPEINRCDDPGYRLNPKGFFVISITACEHCALLLRADDSVFYVWQNTAIQRSKAHAEPSESQP